MAMDSGGGVFKRTQKDNLLQIVGQMVINIYKILMVIETKFDVLDMIRSFWQHILMV